ncbi:MAG: hypothetical protein DDT34_02489 [Firmicutes bacterium]|nr:hypothetical protein [Bacillota bacterium]
MMIRCGPRLYCTHPAMKYEELQQIITPVRMAKYLSAAANNTKRAQRLYRKNIALAHEFYSLLSLVEVALRNKIDKHYAMHFSDSEWIKNQITGFFSQPELRHSRNQIFASLDALGTRYDHNKLVSSLSFGFWTHLFNKHAFRLGGQSLLQIFPRRTHGVGQKDVFKHLEAIREWRNRVAHFEPLCFEDGLKSTRKARLIYSHLIDITSWMGISPSQYFYGLDHVIPICNEIDSL